MHWVSKKTWCQIFCNNFINYFTVGTAMNYLQNKTFRRLLKTSLYYHAKHKFKNICNCSTCP